MQEGDEVLGKWQVCYISHFDGAGVKGIWSEEAGEEAEVEFIAVLLALHEVRGLFLALSALTIG